MSFDHQQTRHRVVEDGRHHHHYTEDEHNDEELNNVRDTDEQVDHHQNIIIKHHHHQHGSDDNLEDRNQRNRSEEDLGLNYSQSVNNFDENSNMINNEEEENVLDASNTIDTTVKESTTIPTTEAPANAHQRQQWGSRLSFILATIGAAIGFGSFVRFPYLAYKQGGGAFLIPYTVCLIVLGIPLLILELSMGQLLRKSSIKALGLLNNRMRGLGIAAVMFGGFGICSYYSVMISWIFVYFYHMFAWELPWKGRSEEYFYDVILRRSSGDTVATELNIAITVSLFLVWVSVYFGVWKGPKSSGFVTYITVPLPILLLLILLITSFFLEGSWTGMYYFIKPDFTKIFNVEIWLSAAGQVFFSLSLASGTMIALSSYNDPKQNIVKDAWIIGLSTYVFSIFAGFCMFAILGYMAHSKGVEIDHIVQGGLALAFVIIPEAITLMPVSHLFCALFLLAMFTLAIDSCFGMIEGVNAVIHDAVPNLKLHWISIVTCLLGFVLGIPFCLDNGIYLMDIVDHYLSDFCLVLSAIGQCIVVGYMISDESVISRVRKQWREFSSSSYASIEEGSGTPPPSINSSTPQWKLRVKKYLSLADTILFHSVDEYRLRVKKVCNFGPHKEWSIFIKYIGPIILLILLIIQLVKEITSPYSTKGESTEFDWLSLTIGLCIIFGYLGVFTFFAIFPRLATQKSEAPGNSWRTVLDKNEHDQQESKPTTTESLEEELQVVASTPQE